MTTTLSIKQEEMPADQVGDHQVHCISGPRRLGAYAPGAGTIKGLYFERHNDLVGFLDYYVEDVDDESEVIHIGYICVRPDWRNRKISSEIIDELVRIHPRMHQVRWGKMFSRHCESLLLHIAKLRPDVHQTKKVYY